MAAEPVELLNLKHPEAVADLHRRYAAAGSRILIANTFAANRLALDEFGLADRVSAISAAGVRLAREAAGPDRMVWASIGPLSLGLKLDDFPAERLAEVYTEQCAALTAADALVLETFTDPRESAAALAAAARTGLPIIFQVGNTGGGAAQWERVQALLSLAERHGAAAVGTNCRHPADTLRTAQFLLGHTRLPVTASTNAGHPRIDRGRVIYDFAARDLRDEGARLAAIGVAVIGGCCGTTPEHIRELAAAVGGRPVASRTTAVEVLATPSPETAGAGQPAPNAVRSLLGSPRFLVSVEIRADRKLRPEAILAGAGVIAEAGADLFDVPDNPGATVGRDATVMAARLQEATGVPSMPHKAVTQSNLIQMHSALIGAWDLGLRGLLAVTGDPPSTGHLAGMASRVADVKSSVELLRLVRTLREGHMINGEEIADPPDFCAGCAFGAASPAQAGWLQKKRDAGAEFVFTQPVFALDDLRRLLDSASLPGLRLFPGIMPLTGRKNAEFFASGRIPGIRIPDAVVQAFGKYASPADQRRFGLDAAAQLATAIAREARGLYLIMPFGRDSFKETAAIVRGVRA
jgi:homocysteine S-methyltransferase